MSRGKRDFRRINFTAKLGKLIAKILMDRVFKDHERKCVNHGYQPGDVCEHYERGTLQMAKLIEAGLTVGKKRAHLDLPCPYLTGHPNPVNFNMILRVMATRVNGLCNLVNTQRSRHALGEIAKEIREFSERNAMEVLAEASLR